MTPITTEVHLMQPTLHRAMQSASLISVFVLLSFNVFSQSDIRAVDFRNFEYEPYCVGEMAERITVTDGEFYEEKEEDGFVDRFFFRIFEIVYGDLTGDKRDEAIILSVCNTGGTGDFSEGFVYGISGGKPKLLVRIPGGDRAYGGLRTARVEGGVLVVESNDVGELGGACCPEFVVTSKYRLVRGQLARFGIPVRREMFPVERVVVARGTTGKTFRTTLPPDEGKRFVVRARAGQELVVSIDTDQAALRLLEDTPISFGINNFLARLSKNGDHTIEIQNNSGRRLTVEMNIRIR
jgi:hypothetical protein